MAVGERGARGPWHPPQTFGEFSIQFTLLRSFRLFLSLTVRLPWRAWRGPKVERTLEEPLQPDTKQHFLTEFNWIATPSLNCVGNPGWHRTRKPVAYRVSCYTHSPHLNIPRSFKIVIYLILEHIYTSSINTFPWQSIPFMYRSLIKCILSYV